MLRDTTACNFSSLIWPAGSAPAALASLLFDPSGATNHWKNTVNRDVPTFSRTCIFFLLISSLLTLLTSAFQLSILSESFTSKLPSTNTTTNTTTNTNTNTSTNTTTATATSTSTSTTTTTAANTHTNTNTNANANTNTNTTTTATATATSTTTTTATTTTTTSTTTAAATTTTATTTTATISLHYTTLRYTILH